uniref:Uncharacterized protein n=1 Tax=Anguilla anguilla TaxID=7936 RepID=A0A0E9XMM8_ANGAN
MGTKFLLCNDTNEISLFLLVSMCFVSLYDS